MTPIQTPWGNLTRLNDISQYDPETAAYEIAQDLEIAHVLGLIRLTYMRQGLSPLAVSKALKGRIEPAASLAWPTWVILRRNARTLQTTGTWTSPDGATTLTYQAAPDGSPLFTVNGAPVSDPADAEVAFLLAHPEAIHFGSAFSALPADLKQTRTGDGRFRWPVLDGSRDDFTDRLLSVRGGLEELSGPFWPALAVRAPSGITPIVLGPSVAEHPALAQLAGLEQAPIVQDRGPATVVELIGCYDARRVVYVGLAEEAQRFAAIAARAGLETQALITTQYPGTLLVITAALAQATGLESVEIEAHLKAFLPNLTEELAALGV